MPYSHQLITPPIQVSSPPPNRSDSVLDAVRKELVLHIPALLGATALAWTRFDWRGNALAAVLTAIELRMLTGFAARACARGNALLHLAPEDSAAPLDRTYAAMITCAWSVRLLAWFALVLILGSVGVGLAIFVFSGRIASDEDPRG